MASVLQLKKNIEAQLAPYVHDVYIEHDQLIIGIIPEHIKTIALMLRDEPFFRCEQLIDVCGMDYQTYGESEWTTDQATATGFERAVDPVGQQKVTLRMPARFGVVYQLLSVSHNHRIRLKAFLSEDNLVIDSMVDIWPAASWFEREAFDLFGILFKGHPDLRRILTDYGFIGHPFRKDFPLIGQVEMRYDAGLGRVVYEPVSIQPRILVPRVVRDDSRYRGSQLSAVPSEGQK